jgi:cobalt-zinc-cadmium efflux system protein
MAHTHGANPAHRRTLMAVLAMTAAFMAVEAVAGVLASSLVLVADAAHMFTDVAALSLALLAIWFAQRPPDEKRTYGYYRTEILAALVNAFLLLAVAAYIIFEAVQRLRDPADTAAVTLIVVASVGLLVNLLSARLLSAGARDSLNMRGAFIEVLGDLLGSAGAVAAGLILLTTGWRYADPIFAILVALLILPRTWELLHGALDVLLEGTPHHISIADVQRAIVSVPGVQSVHDLHVWAVTSGFVALSGHVLVSDDADRDGLLVQLRDRLRQDFDIEHVTVQVENERLAQALEQPCLELDADGCVEAEAGGWKLEAGSNGAESAAPRRTAGHTR